MCVCCEKRQIGRALQIGRLKWNEMSKYLDLLAWCTHSVNYFYYILPLRIRMAEGCKSKGMFGKC
jgi:hypothetical protein